VQLRSLRLEGFHLCSLHFLSRYLKATVHLCRLTFSCRIDVHLAHNRLMHVPALFLHGVRRSGSLRHVEIKHPGWPDARLSDQAQRLFASFMLRNQQVPQMLVGISPVAADNDECNTAAETSHTAVPVPSTVQNASSTALFSTLCVVSNPALLMSPQLILAGLSAAPCKALGSSRSSKRARIVESPSTEAPDDE
jgi:hypothetical protein